MPFQTIKISDFRNIEHAEFQPTAGLNILFGENGSGKTSILEAIYLLVRGRSFRTRFVRPIIRNGAEGSSYVFGDWLTAYGTHHRLGIERSSKQSALLLDGTTVTRLSAVSSLVPLQLLTPQSLMVFSNGASGRRKLFDWGVFHVEHSFSIVWDRYNKLLNQRNLALRSADIKVIKAYSLGFIECALSLEKNRSKYFDEFIPFLYKITKHFSLFSDLNIYYGKGWKDSLELDIALYERLKTDLYRGYTSIGPHQFDVRFCIGKQSVDQVLSNGEKKLLILFIKLAQILYLHEKNHLCSVFLADDPFSELSPKLREICRSALSFAPSQLFLTGTDLRDFSPQIESEKVFHVEHGKIFQIDWV